MDRRKVIIRRVLILFALVVFGLVLGTFAFVSRVLTPGKGEVNHGQTQSVVETLKDITEIVKDPYSGFPGKSRVVILCMGIDDNWTDGDQVYTKQARTDTLFLLSLDLVNKKAAMLSIPRDTYTHIAGTHWNFKINAAYQTGGPQRAIDTVAELTGVQADHYMVLNIDSTKKMVDAVGGVDVTIENEMHYHDKWGHLNIDLMPGEQHLSGDQAVGFARYRHADAGAKGSPEDGDERRMYRQHVLLKALIAKAKTFTSAAQAPNLINVGMSTIRTDLTRTQLFDLAAIYHTIQPEDIHTASLPGEDYRGPTGAWFLRLYPNRMKAYVNWLVRGQDSAARALVPIVIKNGTSTPKLATHAAVMLHNLGYIDVRVNSTDRPKAHATGTAKTDVPAATSIVDTGVPNTDAVSDIKTVLNIPSATGKRVPNKPNHLGWTPPSNVTIVLGTDYAQQVATGGGIPEGETVPTAVEDALPVEPQTPTRTRTHKASGHDKTDTSNNDTAAPKDDSDDNAPPPDDSATPPATDNAKAPSTTTPTSPATTSDQPKPKP